MAVGIADIFYSDGAVPSPICDASRRALLGGFGVFRDSARWQRLFLSKRKKHRRQYSFFVDVLGCDAALSGFVVRLADAFVGLILVDFDPSFWSIKF